MMILQIIIVYTFCLIIFNYPTEYFFNHVEALSSSVVVPAASNSRNNNKKKIVILGGTGKIGTAVAIHLLNRDPICHVVLSGRRENQNALREIREATTTTTSDDRVSFACLDTVWDESSTKLKDLIDQADCLIHTAGPYLDKSPVPLKLALQSQKCQVYVDVSDPLPYLEQSLLMTDEARKKNLTALVAAGAFPGMSNVLAKEAAATASSTIQDVRFHYFTAGLGGSGVVNLYITNLGFGEPQVQYDQGVLRWFMALSGKILGKVDFFLPQLKNHNGNELAKKRVGTQTIFAWPFPEAATVAKDVKARGNSYAGMGTAPDIWNDMLGILVKIVPRKWWKSQKFSKFMADFSEPLVLATDSILKTTGTGETHAMRIDVTTSFSDTIKGVSIVQAHDSFRHCVGQSCAEFALDALANGKPGVYLPEQFYNDADDRSRIIQKLTTTPGTFCYTGPAVMGETIQYPTDWDKAISEANMEENTMTMR